MPDADTLQGYVDGHSLNTGRIETQGASDEAVAAEIVSSPQDPQPLSDEEVAERDRLLEVLTLSTSAHTFPWRHLRTSSRSEVLLRHLAAADHSCRCGAPTPAAANAV